MVSVKINGADSAINTSRLSKFTDLIELVKASIDPDHMITEIRINGHELEEQDWAATLSQIGDAVIDIITGTPESYAAEKLSQSSDIVKACYVEFRDARKNFQAGKMVDGNQALMRAVNTAKSFFEWYATIMQILPAERQSQYDISAQVLEISDICKKICQQQLYQSWWALGETLEKELEPKLDSLEDFCKRFTSPTA